MPPTSSAAAPRPARIPEATVARLPVYLRSLLEVAAEGQATHLLGAAGRDGRRQRRQGAQGPLLPRELRHPRRRLRRRVPAVPDEPGARASPTTGRSSSSALGNLGQALANYGGFTERGFPVAALVDADPAKVGEHDRRAPRPATSTTCPSSWPSRGIAIGVIATPAAAAQDVADRWSPPASRSILNFAPAVISVPDGVSLRKVDLAVELQILSFYQQRRRLTVAAAGATYPVNLVVDGPAGAGRRRRRGWPLGKVAGLLEAGAAVTVVAPEVRRRDRRRSA